MATVEAYRNEAGGLVVERSDKEGFVLELPVRSRRVDFETRLILTYVDLREEDQDRDLVAEFKDIAGKLLGEDKREEE